MQEVYCLRRLGGMQATAIVTLIILCRPSHLSGADGTAWPEMGRIVKAGARSLSDAVVEQLQLGRKERIQQQDEVLKTLFPNYNPPPVGYGS